ncbi:putative LuxR family regulatory protein [Proteus hauseri ATCC 700826]|uniref:LuxR family regulatory protein n=1 Tax=Proteus hauseri ATCC 700826 TaxID=1354271 RepID=A0AAJ3HRA2_PROHU|nr:LuxR C-terminal-related transcriptional regulator [Proteus hauseri]OAT46005.1 putative LuxR family regulatory protein [Proteus hauseri ATCC 700826]
MKVLIIDRCYFTRNGIRHFLSQKSSKHDIIDTASIEIANSYITDSMPDIIFINLTKYCRETSHCEQLQYFFLSTKQCRLYLYIDANYPDKERPIALTNNCFILPKRILSWVLDKTLLLTSRNQVVFPTYKHSLCSIFSMQEQKIINYWMNELPNHQIAKKLKISNSTVYSHKRHITEKINVKNRIELFFIYNILKYIYEK